MSNGLVEVTVLLGGGHIADLRLCGSSINALWESPWPTIEPHDFEDRKDSSLYGGRTVGQMLSGYTGHALAVPYFGMPSESEASRGLALHGEAASAQWHVADVSIGENFAEVTVVTELPLSSMHFRRTLRVESNSTVVAVTECLHNESATARELQWVEHGAFGEPLFTSKDSSMFVSARRGITWPLGYEGHELLPDNLEFQWPNVCDYDLSTPFFRDGTGFVAALLVDTSRRRAYVAVHNRRLNLVAGYVFDRERFPWIAIWEENLAREYPPWSNRTRVRGVEFGTSPMPLGLEHAQQMRTLFGTPVLTTIAGGADLTTSYQMFVANTPPDWKSIVDVLQRGDRLQLQSESGAELLL